MRKFRTKRFHHWSIKEGLTDTILANTAKEIFQGLVGDYLGENVYKKRIKLAGRGKRGGARN